MKFYLPVLLILILAAPAPTQAEDAAFTAFYGSLKADEVNVRAGPGTQYPILWVFKMQGYPVEVIAKYQHWLKVRDIEGEEGWVYRNFISRRKSAVIQADTPTPLTKDREGKKVLARLESGVIARIDTCEMGQCLVLIDGMKGWVNRTALAMIGH